MLALFPGNEWKCNVVIATLFVSDSEVYMLWELMPDLKLFWSMAIFMNLNCCKVHQEINIMETKWESASLSWILKFVFNF